MSDDPLAQRRMSTRSVHRLNQEAANLLDSDTSSSATSPSESLSTNNSASPSLEPKLEVKEEHSYTEPLPASLSSMVLQAVQAQSKESERLALLNQVTYTGRKRKANFSNEETETLVREVVKHFSALYGTEALRTESTRRNQRRSQLWTQIQKHVNDLGYTPRTIDDLKHKWRDLRLEVKRKITHRKSTSKPAAGVTSIIDTKLNPLEDLVASTIGLHCTLDGEQEGMYMEPGIPRQSIFFSCRGPSGSVSDVTADRLGATASPRPTAEISLVSPLVSNSPAQLSFIHISDDGDNEEQEMDVTQTVTVKPFTETWSAVGEICTLVTTQSDLAPAPKKLIISKPEILTVKRELVPVQTVLETGRSDSIASREDPVSQPTGQTEQKADSNGNDPVETGDTIELKVEDESGSRGTEEKSPPQEPAQSNWQENQDEWERQSGSPQPSENAPEDSLRSSSSQEGEPSSSGEAATNGDCACMPHEQKGQWRTNMHRLLELEEQWDTMYHKELGMWEEERNQQREQRAQDRELQQQLLAVLTDIRDELRQIREERVAARQNQASSPSSPRLVVSPPPQDKPSSAGSSASKTPKLAPLGSPVSGAVRRRGRPRINRPTSSSNQS
ncbi:uncharacterized protein LOC128496434 [Spea bombifrons]|uniref:uncharacterized protein LOC128496434 n=1 Tax=Spea bombifrons TaxID=233779 RepID=UPI00234A1DD6|nr:uncharacterized protein LOC128496434 [Spea bombifrons]XP_053322037.1 uncharacterized protein LOC128496434 [Spea bombifrons]XP_053322038.1 uncharacterized protein LOC128496434 [Spea bombifrons]